MNNEAAAEREEVAALGRERQPGMKGPRAQERSVGPGRRRCGPRGTPGSLKGTAADGV